MRNLRAQQKEIEEKAKNMLWFGKKEEDKKISDVCDLLETLISEVKNLNTRIDNLPSSNQTVVYNTEQKSNNVKTGSPNFIPTIDTDGMVVKGKKTGVSKSKNKDFNSTLNKLKDTNKDD